MNVTIDFLPEFERRAKTLAKKYKSIPADYDAFLDELEKNPFGGDPLGHNTYKHRMAIASKGKGKSGASRAGIISLPTRLPTLHWHWVSR